MTIIISNSNKVNHEHITRSFQVQVHSLGYSKLMFIPICDILKSNLLTSSRPSLERVTKFRRNWQLFELLQNQALHLKLLHTEQLDMEMTSPFLRSRFTYMYYNYRITNNNNLLLNILLDMPSQVASSSKAFSRSTIMTNELFVIGTKHLQNSKLSLSCRINFWKE